MHFFFLLSFDFRCCFIRYLPSISALYGKYRMKLEWIDIFRIAYGIWENTYCKYHMRSGSVNRGHCLCKVSQISWIADFNISMPKKCTYRILIVMFPYPCLLPKLDKQARVVTGLLHWLTIRDEWVILLQKIIVTLSKLASISPCYITSMKLALKK